MQWNLHSVPRHLSLIHILEKYDIDIIPLHIVKGNEELEDGPAIDISALYKWADENKTTPKTSAPSIETAMNIMRCLLYTSSLTG